MTKLPPKEVQCDCGHKFTIERRRYWCEKCANPVFYYPEDKRKDKWNTYYMWGVILGVITFLTYLFIEIIVTPFMSI